jgi:peptide/nickel transport system ATP-binding protein
VMYAGRLVEEGPSDTVLRRPLHPYTQLLLSAVPDPNIDLALSEDEVREPPRVIDPDEGCRFRARCPYAEARCAAATPLLLPVVPNHRVACFVAAESGTRQDDTVGDDLIARPVSVEATRHPRIT